MSFRLVLTSVTLNGVMTADTHYLCGIAELLVLSLPPVLACITQDRKVTRSSNSVCRFLLARPVYLDILMSKVRNGGRLLETNFKARKLMLCH